MNDERPVVRLAGRMGGGTSSQAAAREEVLRSLVLAGWRIENSNGDDAITLGNIENRIAGADAFVFLPEAGLPDLFKAASVFVGYQTRDRNLSGKPTVVLNSDGSWDHFFRLLRHLHSRGMIRQRIEDYLCIATDPGGVVGLLAGARDRARNPAANGAKGMPIEDKVVGGLFPKVCVFCSASSEDPAYLAEGYWLGSQLAREGLGCISGAGNSGMMGAVVRGVVEAGGWAAGSNVPHIIELEGLPDGLACFWPRPDIYTRMEVMIERSDAFVIMPGGAGTVQEALALMIFKSAGHPLTKGKPVVIFNRLDAGGFWDPLVDLLGAWRENFVVVDRREEILPAVRLGWVDGAGAPAPADMN